MGELVFLLLGACLYVLALGLLLSAMTIVQHIISYFRRSFVYIICILIFRTIAAAWNAPGRFLSWAYYGPVLFRQTPDGIIARVGRERYKYYTRGEWSDWHGAYKWGGLGYETHLSRYIEWHGREWDAEQDRLAMEVEHYAIFHSDTGLEGSLSLIPETASKK